MFKVSRIETDEISNASLFLFFFIFLLLFFLSFSAAAVSQKERISFLQRTHLFGRVFPPGK